MQRLLVLGSVVLFSEACMKTLPSEPTTPRPPTQAPNPACSRCPTDAVIFHPASGEYTTDALSESLPKNAQGCRRMNAVCQSGSPTDNAFMEFNNGIGGPYVAPTVKAELVCRADQKWYYSDGTTALAITDVHCSTTKPPAATCGTCDPNAVNFHPASGPDGTDALSETLPNNSQGCKQMNAVCESGSPTATSFMEFNNGVGGPPTAPTVKALLVCRADQKWYYTEGANSLAITDVTCTTNAGGGGSTKPCASCDENAVNFQKKTMPDEVDAVKQSLANNAGGCKQMNAVCKASQPGLNAFMEFNGAIGGPVIAETVTSLLTCADDGKWYFTLGQNSLEVTSVSCTEA